MVDVLYKVIKRVIEPKYPWVKKYNWVTVYFGAKDYYKLEVYLDNTTSEKVTIGEIQDLEKDVMMLFKLIGPPDGVYFDTVDIRHED
jgi:hypothetical protein